jgi:formylglycine-generating enzyme required for sulfatase activity
VALVIGNAAYRHADRLDNPINDARGMRDALKKLGFDVVYGEDLDQRGLRRVIGQFANSVAFADVAMVYFAGHGATFGDTPYVVPVDAEFASLAEVPYELVSVETLIGELRQATGVRIAILDACRDNRAERELKRHAARGGPVTRGLAPTTNPSGMIIAYATQYLSTAADVGTAGTGQHSPFTAALLNNIATPGLDVKDMLYKVGRDVNAATGGKQRPEISVSMYNLYALVPAVPNPAEVTPKPGEIGSGAAGQRASPDAAQAWGAVQNSTSLAVLDEFLAQFGTTPIYGALARERREKLAKEQAAEPRPTAGQQAAAVVPPMNPAVPAADPCSGPVAASFPSRCAAPLTAAQERGLKPKDAFRECADCPEMVVVPAGSFTMGSPGTEKDRNQDESPQHVVTISRPFAVGKLHVTVDQFAEFVRETGYEANSKCQTWSSGTASWRNTGFTQEGSHPVVCLSWDDANGYARWLANKTGKPYRLLSEAEWEYAARGQTSPGSYPRFWFGDDEKDLCRYGNSADQKIQESSDAAKRKSWTLAPCNDGYAFTSPAGHYESNPFGLYDMGGNAWQWMADCYHDSYSGAPVDGSAWTNGTCSSGHVVRGGSWFGGPRSRRPAIRFGFTSGYFYTGARLARTLTP